MLSFQKLQHNYKLALESFNNLQIATQDHLLEALTNIDTAAREIMQAKVSRDLLNLLQNTRDKKSHQEALGYKNLLGEDGKNDRTKENNYHKALSLALTGTQRSFDQLYHEALMKSETGKTMSVRDLAKFLNIKLLEPTPGLGHHTLEYVYAEGNTALTNTSVRPSTAPKLYHFLTDVCKAYGLVPARDLMIYPSFNGHHVIRIPRLGRTILMINDTAHTIHVLRGIVAPRPDLYQFLGTKDLQTFPHYIGRVPVSFKHDGQMDVEKYVSGFGPLLALMKGDSDPVITDELIAFYEQLNADTTPSQLVRTRNLTPGLLTPEMLAQTQEIDVRRRVEVTNQFIKAVGSLENFIEKFLVLGSERNRTLKKKFSGIPGEIKITDILLGQKKETVSNQEWIDMLSLIYGIDKISILDIFLNKKIEQKKYVFMGMEPKSIESIRSKWSQKEQGKAKEMRKKCTIEMFKEKVETLENFIEKYLTLRTNERSLEKIFPSVPGASIMIRVVLGQEKNYPSDQEWIQILSQIYEVDKLNILKIFLDKKREQQYIFFAGPSIDAIESIRLKWPPEEQRQAKEIRKTTVILLFKKSVESLESFIKKFLVLNFLERKLGELFPQVPGEFLLTGAILGKKKQGLKNQEWIDLLSCIYEVQRITILKILLEEKIKQKKIGFESSGSISSIEEVWLNWTREEQRQAKEIRKNIIIQAFKGKVISLENFIQKFLVFGSHERRGTLFKTFDGLPGESLLTEVFFGNKDNSLLDGQWIELLSQLYEVEKVSVLKILLNKRISENKINFGNGNELLSIENIWSNWTSGEQKQAKELRKQSIIQAFKNIVISLENFIKIFLILGINERTGKLAKNFPGIPGTITLRGVIQGEKVDIKSNTDRITILSNIYADEGYTVESIQKMLKDARGQ